MANNNDTIGRTFAVVGGLCLVCSILVAGSAVGLRPWQDAAKARDRQANILSVAKLPLTNISKVYGERIDARLLDLDAAQFVAGDANAYDMKKAAKDPALNEAIPPELEEAALVDGSSTLQYAFLVKIPMVSSAILLNAIFSIIGTLQLFNQPQILKAMAPAVINNHYTPNIYARSLAFVGQQYNYAGAVSFLLAAIVAILSFAVLYLAGRRGRKSA